MADGEDKKLTVPKFSSFKTKAPAPATCSGSERSKSARDEGDDRDRRRSAHRHHSHRHQRDSHGRERSHREERRRDSRDDKQTRHKDSSRRPHERDAPASVPGLFVIDTKGDPLIRKYGLDRSKIPAYYRRRGGRALGADGRVRFDWDGPVERFSILLPGQSSSFGERGGLRSKGWQGREAIRIRARKGDTPEEDDSGFLSLENPKKRKRRDRDSESSEAEDQPSWRSIEGKAKAAKAVDSDDEDDDSASDEDVILDRDNPLRWKSMQLSRQVKEHPEDIDAWLELVDHQDDLLRDGETIDDRASENAARSFTEIKVHLLESALTHASQPQDRQRVLVALMRQGVKVWTRPVADKKWAQIASDEEQVFALWKIHLDYAMSTVATVQYEEIKSMLLKRLQQTVSRCGLASREDLEEATYIFLRATRFFHDAGYKELAVAAWQGLLELNIFRPDSLHGRQELLATFESFWENEVPRIGEPGARGWKYYFDAGEPGQEPEPQAFDEPEKPRGRDSYLAWTVAECARGDKAAMPARTMDPGTEDDPFRVVMFSDIESLLFVVPPDAHPDVIPQLVNAFLLFCGFPPAYRCSALLEEACYDQFLVRPRTDLTLQSVGETAVDEQEVLQRKPPAFSNGNCLAKLSPDLLFAANSWFSLFGNVNLTNTVGPSTVHIAVQQLVYSDRVSDLALYYLGLCFATHPSGIKKEAKALLKRYPDNVQLYNAYALAEFSIGNVEVAHKVMISAMGSPALTSAATGFLLFKTWCWMELQLGHMDAAAKRLCSSVDEALRASTLPESGVSPATVLKARQAFMANAEACLHQGQETIASDHFECLLLLEYLTCEGGSEPRSASQGNISAAMNALETICLDMGPRTRKQGITMELVLQCASRLLYSYSTKGPFRRVYLREQLAKFIERFPRNTVFLNLFAWADARIRVIDETRQMLYDKVLVREHDSVSSRIFAIQHELDAGNVDSARTTFENAVRSDACKSSVMLWISYIRFCHSQKQARAKTKARDVFFRALAHCPWSKEVMMEAFVTLAGDLEADELRSVYRTMTSKGLRIHVDLDEILELEKARGIGKVRG
ncbi:hypothetical protein HIM_07668 [Hirsutella minnesotensis 3608]|uniref:DUF1740-domain-containing protein n=1 Tax=Hirsutella minnesotensis 3608 TaxID=1043627 RepID=A0A0F7ZN04_9HYPO|nr:hypothetical protein HIM_07668 [Hirsutella minnesotensis 3608]